MDKKKGKYMKEQIIELKTCRWCYMQVSELNKEKHKECIKKLRKQISRKKKGMEILERNMDSRYIGHTSKMTSKELRASSKTEKRR